ncbi:hypothetical protein ACVMGF_005705 [Bradyrhizobium diazoefficiens]
MQLFKDQLLQLLGRLSLPGVDARPGKQAPRVDLGLGKEKPQADILCRQSILMRFSAAEVLARAEIDLEHWRLCHEGCCRTWFQWNVPSRRRDFSGVVILLGRLRWREIGVDFSGISKNCCPAHCRHALVSRRHLASSTEGVDRPRVQLATQRRLN